MSNLSYLVNKVMGDVPEALSTALTSQKEGIPSIFEAKAQDSLDQSIKPALKHICKIVAHSSPDKCGWLYRWYDELYTAAILLIQQHFLNNHSSSFAEYYYDLRRLPPCGNPSLPLQRKEVLKSLFALIAFPYLHDKLEQKFKEIKEEYEFQQNKNISVFEKFVYSFYPYLHSTWNAIILYYTFMFTIGKAKYHSPLYQMLNLQLVVVDPLLPQTKRSKIFQLLTTFFTGGIHFGVFLIQFMEHWYSEENQVVVKQSTQLPIPKPPFISLEQTKIAVPAKGICPLCNQKLRNEASLMTSGYVFCYLCIYRYVKAQLKCPVTGYNTNLSHIIKIYLPS